MAARVCFIVIFEVSSHCDLMDGACFMHKLLQNIVAMVMIFVRWCIPDIPATLRDQIRREAYITNEIIIHQESLKVKSGM